jgi:hypothetical protein
VWWLLALQVAIPALQALLTNLAPSHARGALLGGLGMPATAAHPPTAAQTHRHTSGAAVCVHERAMGCALVCG